LVHSASAKRFVSLQSLNPRQSPGLLGRGISHSQCRYLTQTAMPRVGFEPTIPLFERANIFHALNRTVIVIGISVTTRPESLEIFNEGIWNMHIHHHSTC
jgi:hypothetical protein